jgi:cytoplasmic tRNA 2-thiolation protein 1
MTTLNRRYDYGLNLFLLSIDEGISGYRDDSLETVKRNQEQYQVPLKILSYKELYGWTMDEIVRAIGQKNNCTFCGVFRRQALDRGAQLLKADKLLTGHNCDDIAETVLLNLLRGDLPRLSRCTDIITGRRSALPRAKPFKYTYEKEIVMYAYFLKLDYFSTECKYAPFAYRGFAREFVKDLERSDNRALLNIVLAAEHFHIPAHRAQVPSRCVRCGYMSSQSVCKACVLLQALHEGNTAAATGGRVAIAEDGTVVLGRADKDKPQRGGCGGGGCGSGGCGSQGGAPGSCGTSKQPVATPEAAEDPDEGLCAQQLERRRKAAEKMQAPRLATDCADVLAELRELGLRVKEGESEGNARRRVKKERGYRLRQASRGEVAVVEADASIHADAGEINQS